MVGLTPRAAVGLRRPVCVLNCNDNVIFEDPPAAANLCGKTVENRFIEASENPLLDAF